MRIRLHSDLHLEAFLGMPVKVLMDKFIPLGQDEREQILVLAGDICNNPGKTLELFHELVRRFKFIIYVPGNHEFYRSSLNEINSALTHIQNFHKDKVFIALDNKMHEKIIDGVRFIFGTLWTDPFIRGQNGAELINFYLNDFRVIKDFNLDTMAELHSAQKQQLTSWLEDDYSGETVVITHHLPSFSLCHPRFGGSADHGFASPCDNLLYSGKINLWCFGHTHDRISTIIGGTKLECNPTGYRGEWDNSFSGGGIVEIELNN